MSAAGDNLARNPRSLDDIEASGAAWTTETELATLVRIARAAQPFVDNYLWWESPDTRRTPEPRINKQHVVALAAALARLNAEEGT